MSTDHFNPQDSELIRNLFQLSNESPKLVRSTIYKVPFDSDIAVSSWKMNEFRYYDVPSPFPTLARGLFSREIGNNDCEQPRYQIIARGYDKFFNIGEVPWTKWSSLEKYTGSPYTLSLKSNGCIIFIAAVSPSALIVTSKHALGPMPASKESHSEVGHRWLRSHLTDKGKSEKELSARLWENNWTAVAELCDDSFEEHVLSYSVEKSGLHLHGINENTKDFRTLPTDIIDAFADEWGFIKTATVMLDTISEVKSFTDEISKTGTWNGEALEGFVVRTHVIEPGENQDKPPPYLPGSSFFFKVKFDEPYMMYRDWREVTKILLSAKGSKGSLDDAKLPKSKLNRKETQVYVEWVKDEIMKNPNAFTQYSKGKGVIATREKFLKWMESEEGQNSLEGKCETKTPKQPFGKTIIVPVAIPGCGKTAVSIALSHLFGFGHTQSDDVKAKKSAPLFISNVTALLKKHDVVIADKNNHLRQHRESLRTIDSGNGAPVRLLALNWALDRPRAIIHRICADRIVIRGENHQSLRADTVSKNYESIIWQFIHNTEELASSEVDECIEMDIEDTLEQAVNKVVDGCVRSLNLPSPNSERLADAIRLAREYTPSVKKPEVKTKQKDIRYFGLLPEIDLKEAIGKQTDLPNFPKAGGDFFQTLISQERFTQHPHSTIVHKNELPGLYELWERCAHIDQMPAPPSFKFVLGHLLWNEEVMVVTVDDFQIAGTEVTLGQEGQDFVSKLSADIRDRLHITLGTQDETIPTIRGKDLVQVWRLEKEAGIGSVKLKGIEVQGRIKRWSY
ncbi:RNA ligase-domain-containing protein [Hygrophoropsis aurantiaca]|uniref:RNA ligase-domain-containing protein n=1 Tax=Hygrophoropsis aurantiaca TaxID=72124 RepID=A0ACB8ACM8_9AGAM|nr:RNA ligase-domain-containing protein [Hygrophoropsis aurantiaca]